MQSYGSQGSSTFLVARFSAMKSDGKKRDRKACFAEITARGTVPLRLPNGEIRAWLEDGDELTIRGWARRDGYVPIGFGPCDGRIAPALAYPS